MALLLRLPDPSTEEAFARYEREATRLVGGAQRSSATFAMAYLGQLSPPVARGDPPTLDRALHGVAVTAASPVARSPVLRLLARLKDGDEEPIARRAAGSYAGELGSGDVHAAERGGLDEAARVGGRRIRGWRKELGPDPCPWCVTIASGGGRYHRADTVPFHARDHCSVAPVFVDEGEGP